MTDPIKSQYDTSPYDPNAQKDPKAPKDSNQSTDEPSAEEMAVPDLKVAWDTRPSFNANPKDPAASGPPGGEGSVDARDFQVSYEALGTQVNEMLQRARGLVDEYEQLRSKLQANQGTIFGQNSRIEHDGITYDFQSNSGSGDGKPWYTPTDFAEPAKQFADQMNPHQDATLHKVGNSLVLVGEYIALVNKSGQVYAAAERQSAFPPPPPNGVTG
jgi:hypothetical protein